MASIAERVKQRKLPTYPWTDDNAQAKITEMVNAGEDRRILDDAFMAWLMRDNDGTGDINSNMDDFMNAKINELKGSRGGKKSKRRRSTRRRSTRRRSTRRRSTKRRSTKRR